jgi:hypothetical protein
MIRRRPKRVLDRLRARMSDLRRERKYARVGLREPQRMHGRS